MAFNSNGQISYLVLDSLAEGSKYGLEIIEYITKKTNGGFIMKKPTLYSCLTRMEKKGLVSSSYWGESELGGKRHYYSITDAGRESLKELEETFSGVEVSSSIFEAEPEKTSEQSPVSVVSPSQEVEKTEEKDSTTFLEQSNFFDMVKPTQTQVVEDDEDDEDAPLENQINFFDMPAIEEKQEIQEEPSQAKIEEEKVEESTENQEKMDYYQSILENDTPAKDDAVLLDDNERVELSKDQEEQNKMIFDSSSELKKYRKKKSFSENQIEMSVVYENNDDEDLQKARIAELKQSLLNMKNGYVEEEKTETEPQNIQEEVEQPQPVFVQPAVSVKEYQSPAQEQSKEEEKDDGIFITARMSATEVPVQRKIAPPNIDVFKDKLPAPKRNSELEPTYKDMMSKIFERKKEKELENPTPVQDTKFQSLNSYADLKKYYNSQGIDFKEYQKAPVKKTHNTNLLKFVGSLVMLGFSTIASVILFIALNASGNILHSTSFMFYTIPLCFVAYSVYRFVVYKTTESKKPVMLYNAMVCWIVFGLSSLVVLVINIICGMQIETIAKFLTSLLLPIIAFAIIFPANYYIQKYLFARYFK